MLTEYEEKMFNNLNTLTELNKWFGIKQDRSDLKEFIAVIKKRIDQSGDFEFSNDYTLFKRVHPFGTVIYQSKLKHDFMPDIEKMHKEQTEQLNIKYPKEPWKR